jgi:hypothetical protein
MIMSNLVSFDRSSRKPAKDEPRWKIVLIYSGTDGKLYKEVVQIEELAELQALVEHGPDWNELVIGTITLQRRLEALPSRATEGLEAIMKKIDSIGQ